MQKTKNKMTDLTPDLSIITLSVNGLNPLKVRAWQNGLKNMIQIYAVYQKHT